MSIFWVDPMKIHFMGGSCGRKSWGIGFFKGAGEHASTANSHSHNSSNNWSALFWSILIVELMQFPVYDHKAPQQSKTLQKTISTKTNTTKGVKHFHNK
ncbi:hypothetical protein CDL12_13547 [Handroanthus impetiginosus]|uniref:Uncharacterized protein n=1 Tax=Handroanthus impetiginosus TaxID=429701 RepID=A0A2G9H8I6_9LAMI|nr:hypothetical protein CDL12_13547 [Handroanthus impetiginosus]